MANIYLGPGFTQTSVTGPRKVKGVSSCHRKSLKGLAQADPFDYARRVG